MLKATSSIVNVSQITGVLPVVNGGTGVTTSTGTGSTVLSSAPTLSGNVTLSTGNLIVASGQGIDFSATSGTGTSELLADYEEGTWAPTFKGDGGGADQTYSVQTGNYTKIGNQVTAWFRIIMTARGTPSGSAILGGLPFTVKNSVGASAGAISNYVNLGINNYSLTIYPIENTSFCYFFIQDNFDGSQDNASANLVTNNAILLGFFTYQV